MILEPLKYGLCLDQVYPRLRGNGKEISLKIHYEKIKHLIPEVQATLIQKIKVYQMQARYLSHICDGEEMCRRTEEEVGPTGRAPNAIGRFIVIFNVPVQAPTRSRATFYILLFRETANLLAFYDTLEIRRNDTRGIWRTHSRLKPHDILTGAFLIGKRDKHLGGILVSDMDSDTINILLSADGTMVNSPKFCENHA